MSKIIKTQPITLQHLQNQSTPHILANAFLTNYKLGFTFLSTECYMVLVVYRRTKEEAGIVF